MFKMGSDLVTKCSIIAIGISVGVSLILTLVIFFHKNDNHHSNTKPQKPFANMIHARELYSQLPPYQPKRFQNSKDSSSLARTTPTIAIVHSSEASMLNSSTMTSPPQDVTHLVSHALMKTTTSSLEATSSRTTASTTEVAANVTGPSINSLGFDEQLLVINGYLTNGVYAQIERANLSNLTDVHECLLLDGFNNQMEKFTLNIVQNHLMQCGGVIWGRPGGNGTNNDTLDAYASLNCAYRNLSFPMLQYPRVLATSVLIPPNRIFIAGGEVPGSHSLLKSTEIIQFSDDFKEIHSIRGPDMPLPLNHNCLIFDPELEILMSIGGRSLYDGDRIPIGISMILHLNESSSWMYGPPLKQKRLGHSCGLLKLANTTVVVVAGGISEFMSFQIPLDSVEMLVHGENGIGKYWQTGPPLPKAVYYGSPAMMSLESSLLLSHQHSLFKLNCSTTAATSSLTDECHWTEAAQVWQNPYILSHIFILHSDLEKKLTCQ